MIEPATTITVTLPARGWNAVLTAMGEGLAATQALMQDIQRQCMAADRPFAGMGHPPMSPRPNGEDLEELIS